jgi:hypothetical protein
LLEVVVLRPTIVTLIVEDVSGYRDNINVSLVTMGAWPTVILVLLILNVIMSWSCVLSNIRFIHALVHLLWRSGMSVLNMIVLYYRVSNSRVLTKRLFSLINAVLNTL